ncbi:MAG: DnaJ domain-containing protein [Nitrospirae bacterium]|nr:DnaJ domain-containing protein [Nitrospirota bacterium]
MEIEIPAKGTLKDYPLPKLLSCFSKDKKTGTLTLHNNNLSKHIYIKDGYAMSASPSEKDDRLGRLFLKEGRITTEQYSKAVGLLAMANKRIGDILLELGYITPPELFHALSLQTKKIISGAFLWEEGFFSFEENLLPRNIIDLKIKIDALVNEWNDKLEKTKTDEKTAFIEKVSELYKKTASLSHYEIFAIPVKASSSEIKKKYLEMVKYFHPDRYLSILDDSIKDKLTAIITAINAAYDVLSDEAKRLDYDSILLRKWQKNTANTSVVNAEEQFKRGFIEFKKGNFWGAVDFFQWATRLNPKKAAYLYYLSLSLKNIPQRHKEAEESILKAIDFEPYNANYYVCLGSIYLQAGINKRAKHQFETALKWDPTNEKAKEGLEKLREKK